MTYGYGGSPGLECFFPIAGTPTKFFGISPTVDGDVLFYDKNAKVRLEFGVTGEIYLRDHNGYLVYASEGSANTTNELLCRTNDEIRLGLNSTSPYIMVNGGNYARYKIPAFQTGTITLNDTTGVSVTFTNEFPGTPRVLLIPQTNTSGVIAAKVTAKSATGFTAIIGGTVSGNIAFDWIAVYGGTE